MLDVAEVPAVDVREDAAAVRGEEAEVEVVGARLTVLPVDAVVLPLAVLVLTGDAGPAPTAVEVRRAAEEAGARFLSSSDTDG